MAGQNHPKKEVDDAVDYALHRGWTLELRGGHCWGVLLCHTGNEMVAELPYHPLLGTLGMKPIESGGGEIVVLTERIIVSTYSFTLLLEGADVLAPDTIEALYAGGCDDATFGQQAGVMFADFDRDAPSYLDAVLSAITDIERAVSDLTVYRLEPEEFVSQADIAARTKRSRESVRLLVEGERRTGGFPQPALRIAGKRPLYRWSEVVNWFESHVGEMEGVREEAQLVSAVNGMLSVRRYSREIAQGQQQLLTDWLTRQLSASA